MPIQDKIFIRHTLTTIQYYTTLYITYNMKILRYILYTFFIQHFTC